MQNSLVRWLAARRVGLLIVTLCFVLLLHRQTAGPAVVSAAVPDNSHLYIEPGTTVIRDPDSGGQIQGKIVIDRRTGDVWGFPTSTSAPYPVVLSAKDPPISKPTYLGRFDFAAIRPR